MPKDPSQSLSRSVLRAGKELSAAADTASRESAADRLAKAAERSIAQFDSTVVQGFDGAVLPVPVLVTEDARDVLAAALQQLQVVNTVFAASRVLDRDDEADREVLAIQLGEFESAVSLAGAAENSSVFGFAPAPVATAADFRKLVAEAYAGFASRSAKTIVTSFSGIRDRGPGAVRDAWSWVNEKLELDKIGGRLVKLGLRALLGVLRLLSRLVPAARTDSVQQRVERLIDAVDRGSPTAALAGAAIGADEAARRSDALLCKEELDADHLGTGALDLGALTAKHGRTMDLCDGVAAAIGIAAKFTTAVPQLPMLVLGAQVLLIASVVVIGRDCTGDAGAIVEGVVAR